MEVCDRKANRFFWHMLFILLLISILNFIFCCSRITTLEMLLNCIVKSFCYQKLVVSDGTDRFSCKFRSILCTSAADT